MRKGETECISFRRAMDKMHHQMEQDAKTRALARAVRKKDMKKNDKNSVPTVS